MFKVINSKKVNKRDRNSKTMENNKEDSIIIDIDIHK